MEINRGHTPQGLFYTEVPHNFYKAHKVLSLQRETVPTLSWYSVPGSIPNIRHPTTLAVLTWEDREHQGSCLCPEKPPKAAGLSLCNSTAQMLPAQTHDLLQRSCSQKSSQPGNKEQRVPVHQHKCPLQSPASNQDCLSILKPFL